MKRKLLVTALVIAVIAVAGALIGRHLLIGYLTPDLFVTQIEKRWNCRAQIESVETSLVGTPGIRLRGVALAPRDADADNALPLGERTPFAIEQAEISSESILLELRPRELIRRELNIQQLLVEGLRLRTSINEDGDASVERLFEKVESSSAEDADELVFARAQIGAEEEDEEEEVVWSTRADRIEVQGGEATFLVEASGATIQLSNLNLALTEIDVDPNDLHNHNRALGQFGVDLLILPPKDSPDTEPYFSTHVSGQGRIQPYDPETGEIDTIWTLDLTLHQGAEINTFPVVAKLQEVLEESGQEGLDLGDLSIRGTLLADTQTQIGHAQGKYLVKDPLLLPLPDTELTVQKGSWFHSGTNQHRLQGTMVASEQLTVQIEGKVDIFLEQKAGNFASEGLRTLLLSPLMKEERLTVEFSSKGDLSSPKVDLVTPLGDLSEVLGTGKEALKGLEEVGKSLLDSLLAPQEE